MLAAFEAELHENLKSLRAKLSPENWFGRVELGSIVAAPRSARRLIREAGGIVRVGETTHSPVELSIRLQLQSHPEFAVAEVLYLWEFGPALEAVLSDSCVGYRLRRAKRDGVMDRYSRHVYEHWPSAFERYRTDPIREAKSRLRKNETVAIISTDVTSFFDSIDPNFLISDAFVGMVENAADAKGREFSTERYLVATQSLLERFSEFRALRTNFGRSATTTSGVPIGAFTSRVFANLALAGLDDFIESRENVALYRRYVDDIVLVTSHDSSDEFSGQAQLLDTVLPGFQWGDDVAMFRVPNTNGHFTLKKEKTRVHLLTGLAGVEFLDAVGQSYSLVSSERRAFIGDFERLEEELETIETFSEAGRGNDRIPRLRDADRFTIRRYMSRIVVNGLRQSVLLLERDEAQRLLTDQTRRLLAILDDSWDVADFEFVLSLYRIALLCGCEPIVLRLHQWLDRCVSLLQDETVERVIWSGFLLSRTKTLRAVQAYLRSRIHEAWATSEDLFEPVVSEHGKIQEPRQMYDVGLRLLDREDEHSQLAGALVPPDPGIERQYEKVERRLRRDRELKGILNTIGEFLLQSERLQETIWQDVLPVQLLLASKPPTYMDVARRQLARAEENPPSASIARRIDVIVDALRGTRYSSRRNSNFSVSHTSNTVLFEIGEVPCTGDVRLILANLNLRETAFEAAATGHPELHRRRSRELANLLREIRKVARTRKRRERLPAIAVFPELSIPRRWVRSISNYAAREDIALILGTEFSITSSGIVNQAVGLFPTGYLTGVIVTWTKRHPAREEEVTLARLGLRYRKLPGTMRRVIVNSTAGRVGLLICSELLEVAALNDLFGRVEILIVPAWNRDTGSFDYAAHTAASLHLHSFVCVANNSEASDSRIVSPISEPRHEREWCRIVHKHESRIIWGDIPAGELTRLHDAGLPSSKRKYRPLPPGWKRR